MKANDHIGEIFGSLVVKRFDSDRYNQDQSMYRDGLINRVRRHVICQCLCCGREVSVRTENLVSGNTTGCGCDMYRKGADTRHAQRLNRYEYNDDGGYIIGYSNNTNHLFYIDVRDYEVVLPYCWSETNYGYMAARSDDGRLMLMHRLIMFGDQCFDNDCVVDHINRDRLDNRRSNLRICTPSGNAQNTKIQKNNTSGICGVSWDNATHKWRAYICHNYKYISLGYYETKDDAISARKLAEQQYFGEFAPQ